VIEVAKKSPDTSALTLQAAQACDPPADHLMAHCFGGEWSVALFMKHPPSKPTFFTTSLQQISTRRQSLPWLGALKQGDLEQPTTSLRLNAKVKTTGL
jgi:exoribonuclease II